MAEIFGGIAGSLAEIQNAWPGPGLLRKKRGSTPWRFIFHNLKNLKAWTVPRSLAETQQSQHQVGLLFSIAETRKPGQSRGRKRHGGVSVPKQCV